MSKTTLILLALTLTTPAFADETPSAEAHLVDNAPNEALPDANGETQDEARDDALQADANASDAPVALTEPPVQPEHTEPPRTSDAVPISAAPAAATLPVPPPTDHDQEAADICDATCASAFDTGLCETTCLNETTLCFNECDNLAGHGDDCFVNCTQIAVDFGARYEEAEEARLLARLAEEAEGPLVRPLAFGINVFSALHYTPKFALNALLDRSIPHWRDHPKAIFGGEFLLRFNNRNDAILAVDWADFRTRDGWWLEKGLDDTATDWVENDLRALTITLAWNAVAPLDARERFHIYGGLGIGAAIRFGDFKKAELNVNCVDESHDPAFFSSATPDTYCPNLPGSQMLLNRNAQGEVTDWEVENIPRVLPSLLINLGMRYIIADTISIGIEGGFKTAAFYGGLKIGVVAGKRVRASSLQSAPGALPADAP